MSELVSKDDTVNVPSVGGRPSRSLQRQTLSEVIEPRYSELMGLVNQTIDSVQAKLREEGIKHHLAAGVVLTGGAAQIEGVVECAERVFRNQVRVGKPLEVSGLTDYVKEPYHSTAVGLLHYARDMHLATIAIIMNLSAHLLLAFSVNCVIGYKKSFNLSCRINGDNTCLNR